MELNVYAAVLLFACLQGCIYAGLFIKRGFQESRQSDYWLAGLVVSLCVFNLPWMLGYMGIYVLGQEWWFFPQSIGLVVGPIIFYYFKTQINVDFKFRRSDFWHFVPYLIYFLYHFILFFSGKTVLDACLRSFHGPFKIGEIESIIENISAVIYLVFAWVLYRNYIKWLPTERADIERVKFDWYRNFLIAIVIGVFTAVLISVIGAWVSLSYFDIWLQRAIVAGIIYYVCIAGYAQVQPHNLLFDGNNSASILAEEHPQNTETFASKVEPKLDTTELILWKQKIENVMITEKLYLESELTLSELSSKLNSYNSLISNVINVAFGKNFNDFVNEFRVNIFQEKMNDPKLKHLTLLAIAYDCGFNSKSTFNRAVKKVTGKLPSEFIAKV